MRGLPSLIVLIGKRSEELFWNSKLHAIVLSQHLYAFVTSVVNYNR